MAGDNVVGLGPVSVVPSLLQFLCLTKMKFKSFVRVGSCFPIKLLTTNEFLSPRWQKVNDVTAHVWDTSHTENNVTTNTDTLTVAPCHITVGKDGQESGDTYTRGLPDVV